MLIRIRTPENETIRLQVDSSTNFSDLLAQAAAAASCSLDAASLSLNGTDAIVAVSNASVAEAGLAQGNLIYLLVRAEGDETATPSPSDTRQAPPIAALPPSPIKAQGEASGTGDETVTPSPSDIAPPVAALPPPIREASGTIAGTSARAAARRRLGRHLRQDKVAKRRGLTVGLTVPQSPAESGGSAEEAMPDGAVTEATPDGAVTEATPDGAVTEATPDGAVAEQATPDEGVTAPVGGPLAAITPPPPLAASCREEELRKATLNKWKVLLFGKSSPDKGLKPLMRRLRRLKAGG
uniref:Ubiquitin-like domain-containing protein n=2 Tax=Emiliania huxleyi TaxID=2903 RepID=A0A0D3K4B1_EMIH1